MSSPINRPPSRPTQLSALNGNEIDDNANKLEALELRIAKLLRLGVIVAGALMLVGWLMQVQFTSNPFLDFQQYVNIPLSVGIAHDWETANWAALISYAGLLVLISLPILRVLMTAILFTKQGEKVLASVAFFVFTAIIVSCCLGFEL